ncbi:MAG: hypothetical protein LUC39_01725 [Clostridiales bacterium]|nr:hypothetical protein [Clostridiales bacterium]
MDAKDFTPVTRDFTMGTGERVPLSINFFLLSRLKRERPEVYERFFRVYAPKKGQEIDPIFSTIDVLYTGYVCGCMAKQWEPMDYDEFLMELPEDMDEIMKTGSALIKPKKAAASGKRSGDEPTGDETE